MSTTERGILEAKVLPELQAIASSMGVQGFQRLRKADLIGAIIAKAQGVEFVPSAPARSRRGGATSNEAGAEADQPELPGADAAEAADAPAISARSSAISAIPARPASDGNHQFRSSSRPGHVIGRQPLAVCGSCRAARPRRREQD